MESKMAYQIERSVAPLQNAAPLYANDVEMVITVRGIQYGNGAAFTLLTSSHMLGTSDGGAINAVEATDEQIAWALDRMSLSRCGGDAHKETRRRLRERYDAGDFAA